MSPGRWLPWPRIRPLVPDAEGLCTSKILAEVANVDFQVRPVTQFFYRTAEYAWRDVEYQIDTPSGGTYSSP